MTHTTPRRFVGQNIKGTPAMPAKKVRQDLVQVRNHSDAFALQEFKWPWYWHALEVVLSAIWGTFPAKAKGLADPILGAQGLGWNRKIWRKIQGRAVLLMEGGGLTTKRYLRAVLLQDRATKMRCWHGTTHFQVGGDHAKEGSELHSRLFDNIDKLDSFLHRLKRTGYPIIFELDANIHNNTQAFGELSRVVHEAGGTFQGDLGVEYLFIIQGHDSKIIVDEVWTIPTSVLNTDHEGRGITFHLVSK